MKFLPIASLTLITSLSLTGCATAPSIEDQAKLKDYEKCLDWELKKVELFLTAEMYKEDYPAGKTLLTARIQKTLEETNFDGFSEPCEKYRP